MTPGVTNRAKATIVENEPFSCFELLFDKFMLSKIRKSTETEGRRQMPNWQVSNEEILAFIGVLYIRGASAGSKLDIDSFWQRNWGIPIFAKTMYRNRFREIMRFLRFDDKNTRSLRLREDKFCMVSENWSKLVQNSQAAYNPNCNLTVDEQLLPSKSRCPFTQNMPCKPDKFGIKFWVLFENDSKYVINILPYLGKNSERPNDESLATFVLKKLLENYLNVGYNVTCDNFFTSADLA